MDAETSPFQVNLGYQVPDDKPGDYVGRAALERQRQEIAAGRPPFPLMLVGLKMAGRPITDYAPDFWLIHAAGGGPVGYVTSAWHSPELGCNIALGFVPWEQAGIGTTFDVALPVPLRNGGAAVEAQVAEVPFRRSEHPSARERQG